MTDSLTTSLAATFGITMFVLSLAWAVLKGIKVYQSRRLTGSDGAANQLRFVQALAVGQRERLVVVDHDGERLLLGITSGGISLLTKTTLKQPVQKTID